MLEASPIFKAMSSARKEEARRRYRDLFNKFSARTASKRAPEKLAKLPNDAMIQLAIKLAVDEK